MRVVCVRESDRERERERTSGGVKESNLALQIFYCSLSSVHNNIFLFYLVTIVHLLCFLDV
jgi:hypothetical protein